MRPIFDYRFSNACAVVRFWGCSFSHLCSSVFIPLRQGFVGQVCGFIGVYLFFAVSVVSAQTEPPKAPLPSLLICGKKQNTLTHVTRGKVDWECEWDGPVLDVQPQPVPDRYLVTGGVNQVSLIRKVWKGCRTLWDWGKLEGILVKSAVVADWDTNGNPTLVLAADILGPRLFLADAKTHSSKIRWEYKLPAEPLRVHLCPDTGNFLVVLKDSSVQEIFFQEDKVVWTTGKEEGFKDIKDAVRDPWARTYIADAAEGSLFCLDPSRNLAWKTHLPFASGACEDMALSIFKKKGKRMVMASVHFTGDGKVAQDVIYLLSCETGNVLAWSDRLEKGGYPSFTKAVPDLAVYQKKE